MDETEVEDVKEPQTFEEKARLICGRVEHLSPDGVIERLEPAPMPV